MLRSVASLAADFPELEVLPVCADYTSDFEIYRNANTAEICIAVV